MTGSTNFGQLIMSGTGTLFLTNNANNALFTGRIVVNSGAVQASVPNAFGANGTFLSGTTVVTLGTTHVSGGTNTGRVELVGGNSFAPETLVLEGRGVTNTQLLNVSGNNTWTGPVSLATGGGSYAIQSDAGTLTISGNVTNTTASAGIRTVALRDAQQRSHQQQHSRGHRLKQSQPRLRTEPVRGISPAATATPASPPSIKARFKSETAEPPAASAAAAFRSAVVISSLIEPIRPASPIPSAARAMFSCRAVRWLSRPET